MSEDLTIPEAVIDPMIAQILQADSVSSDAFASLLHSSARVQISQMISRLQEERAEAFYNALGGAEERLHPES